MRVPVDVYSTLLVLPALDFPHERLNRRERGDPALEEGLDKLLHYVMGRGGLERMTAVKYGLWRHLQRSRHHVALFIDEAELDRLGEWAEAANAVYLLPDGTIRDPFGRVLIGKEGSGDAHARIPFPADARARKARSEALLEARGIAIFDGLPPVVGEGEVALRSTDETVRRALALYLPVRRALALYNGAAIDMAALERASPAGAAALTPAERAFLASAAPERQEIADFLWRIEAFYLLLWALGGTTVELPFPAEPSTTYADIVGFMAPLTDDKFFAHARLRPAADILDALDLHLRCHWALVELRCGRGAAPDLDESVVRERHHALNWLVRFEDAAWDDVETPT